MEIRMHRNTVIRAWGPLTCHSSAAITSCFSMIRQGPMSQGSVHNSWKLNMSQLFHGLLNHQTHHSLRVFGMLWVEVYSNLFQFPWKWSGTSFHRLQSTAWSTLCERDVSRWMRQMVIAPDTDWVSDPLPYLFLKVSLTNRSISLFPVMWNP